MEYLREGAAIVKGRQDAIYHVLVNVRRVILMFPAQAVTSQSVGVSESCRGRIGVTFRSNITAIW